MSMQNNNTMAGGALNELQKWLCVGKSLVTGIIVDRRYPINISIILRHADTISKDY